MVHQLIYGLPVLFFTQFSMELSHSGQELKKTYIEESAKVWSISQNMSLQQEKLRQNLQLSKGITKEIIKGLKG